MISKIKIVFIGTPEFGAIVLEKLIENDLRPILVITAPDKPVGRKQIITPPPVKVLAEKYNIKVSQPAEIQKSKSEIRNLNPDLIAVAAFGQILPKDILEIPKHGCLNLHPSLLPRWRGASPIQFTILSGDKETGTTIILMDEKMDHGPIVAQNKWPIVKISEKEISYKELENILANLGAELLIETIPKWIKGEIKAQPQDNDKATYTVILKKEDGKIDWDKPAEKIERKIRAFENWPGCFCFWPQDSKKLRLKILKAGIQTQTGHGPFGVQGKTFQASNNKIAVQTGKEFLIVEELQLEGGKTQKSEEFLRGHPDFVGTVLE